MPEESLPIFSARLDSSVREALRYLRPVLPDINVAIVRVLDSTGGEGQGEGARHYVRHKLS